MTKYRVTNGWWEGVIEAEEVDHRCRDENDDRGRLLFFSARAGPMGEILIAIVTPTLVVVQQDALTKEVMHESCCS